ncbi:MAG: hypothetical protein H7X88_01795 [Gloeobacteraceae cyanobacterium ES-bin-316]|nr:hypothetical protein [Ferruginibacter sp.]
MLQKLTLSNGVTLNLGDFIQDKDEKIPGEIIKLEQIGKSSYVTISKNGGPYIIGSYNIIKFYSKC